MNPVYTALLKQADVWWVGWIDEVPGVNCQEKSREALLESLRTTLKEALNRNRNDAISAAGAGYTEQKITVLSEALC